MIQVEINNVTMAVVAIANGDCSIKMINDNYTPIDLQNVMCYLFTNGHTFNKALIQNNSFKILSEQDINNHKINCRRQARIKALKELIN